MPNSLIKCQCCGEKLSVRAKCCLHCGDPNLEAKRLFNKNKVAYSNLKNISFKKKQITKKMIAEGESEFPQKKHYIGVEECPCCSNCYFFCHKHFLKIHVEPITIKCDSCNGLGVYLVPKLVTYGDSEGGAYAYPTLVGFKKNWCKGCNESGKLEMWKIIGDKLTTNKNVIIDPKMSWGNIKDQFKYMTADPRHNSKSHNITIMDKYHQSINYISSISDFEHIIQYGHFVSQYNEVITSQYDDFNYRSRSHHRLSRENNWWKDDIDSEVRDVLKNPYKVNVLADALKQDEAESNKAKNGSGKDQQSLWRSLLGLFKKKKSIEDIAGGLLRNQISTEELIKNYANIGYKKALMDEYSGGYIFGLCDTLFLNKDENDVLMMSCSTRDRKTIIEDKSSIVKKVQDKLLPQDIVLCYRENDDLFSGFFYTQPMRNSEFSYGFRQGAQEAIEYCITKRQPIGLKDHLDSCIH